MTSTPHRSTHDRPHAGGAAMMAPGFETGFALHPIQERAARATPRRWVDAIVVETTVDGWIDVVELESGIRSRVWHYLELDVSVGEPVSLHSLYSVLAVGNTLVSVRAA